ncbi:MAG: hypothetical protein KBD53_01560 [Candidatus Omnitrophica bacterium]|nr:hypothetical protein [Candidatus Omnitrophota bacterium]
MEILKLIYSLSLPWWMGYQILFLIGGRNKLDWTVSSAIAFGIGFGILSQIMLILGILNVEFSVFNISAVLIFLGGGSWLIKKIRTSGKEVMPIILPHKLFTGYDILSPSMIILIKAIIVYYIVYVFWNAISFPVYEWDSVSTAIYNAKVIYFDRSLKSFEFLAHRAYPLHIPFLTVWISTNLGFWTEQTFKIIFPLTLCMFTGVFYQYLASQTNKNWSLLGVFMLFSSNLLIFHASATYRDLSLMFYNCSAIIFLLIWKDQKQDTFLILAALFSGFGTFIKQEGTAYLLVHILVMLTILIKYKTENNKAKAVKAAIFLILTLGIYSLFFGYKILNGYNTTEYLSFNFYSAFQQIPLILVAFIKALFFTANWNILWALLFVSAAFNIRKIKNDSNIQVLLITITLFFALLMSLSLVVEKGLIINVYNISRILLHFFPLCPLAIILLISRSDEQP